jgi:4'-phosphopantetheinyl transferase
MWGDRGGSVARGPPVADGDGWAQAPPVLTLAPDEVQVWRAGLDAGAVELERRLAGLPEDERRRAGRFLLERDRRRFVMARSALRELLGRYLGAEGRAIRLVEGPHGKPALAARAGAARGLEFNVSHSGDLALLAFARGRAVGVDVERAAEGRDLEALAGIAFSPAELSAWRGVPEPERERAFYACWCRKEAILKAVGTGLSLPTTCFTVTLAPGEAPRLVEWRPDPAETARWTLHALPAPGGYEAALAYERGPARVTRYGLRAGAWSGGEAATT